MEEVAVRANIIRLLIKKGIKNMKDVTAFCRKYAVNANEAIEELGAKRKDLLK